MPERSYMVIDQRRDHFRIPDPLQSKAAGSPDVCTACHNTKTAEWASGEIAKWFPNANHGWQDRSAFIAFDNGDVPPTTLKALVDYALDIDRPDIVRASALDNMTGRTGRADLDKLAGLLANRSDLVRTAVAHAMRGVEATKLDQLLKPLLSDPVRSARQAAAADFWPAILRN